MKSGKFIIKYRWLIIALSVIIPVAVGLQIFRAEIDPDLEKYIPANMSSRINTERIEEIFGGDEMLIVIFETEDVLDLLTLERIKNIRRELRKMEEIDQILSIYDTKNMTTRDGMLLVEPFINKIPDTDDHVPGIRNG